MPVDTKEIPLNAEGEHIRLLDPKENNLLLTEDSKCLNVHGVHVSIQRGY